MLLYSFAINALRTNFLKISAPMFSSEGFIEHSRLAGTSNSFEKSMFFLLLASISEIYMFSNSSNQRRISLSIACLIISSCTGFVWLSVWQYFKSLKDVDIKNMFYFTEFFSGVKATGKARVYSVIFLLRKTVFWWIVLLLHKLMSLTLLNSAFVLVQFWYLSFCVIVRPLAEVKDNIVEIFNETIFIVLWSLLILYQSADQ